MKKSKKVDDERIAMRMTERRFLLAGKRLYVRVYEEHRDNEKSKISLRVRCFENVIVIARVR